MSTARIKLAAFSINENFFSPVVLQGAKQTRLRAESLNQHWRGLNLNKDPQISIYDCYPFLFTDAFGRIKPALLSDFSLATKLIATSLLYADKLMDLTPSQYEATLLLEHILALQIEGNTLLHQLFPPDSPFWPRYHVYFAHYQHVCLLEKQFANGSISWKEFDESTAWDIATGKAGVSRAVPVGLAELSGDERRLNIFVKVLDYYYFAHQMFDDLCDWKDDYLHQSPSFLLCNWLPGRPTNPNEKDLNDLARELYYGGYACTTLQLAVDALEQAQKLLSSIPEVPWSMVMMDLHTRCECLLRDILSITEKNRRRASEGISFHLELPPARSAYEDLAWKALCYLIRQWKQGFGEASHLMRFPFTSGFTGTSEFQSGDVFQRAILAETFWQASQAFQIDLRPVLDYEVSYLVGCRCRDGIGGWSYFPDLPELAPDADDLAQMMQVLIHAGRREAIQEYGELALTTLLTENLYENGSFETWIIPQSHPTPKQEKQLIYAQHAWGTGPDVDVMANLLYALELYDHDRFAAVIEAGVRYIEAQQQLDGSWSSTWYHGLYYGTFVCMRLLATLKATSPALGRAEEFLRTSQLPDGGWPLENEQEGNVLSTALAMAGLSFVAKADEPIPPLVEQAMVFLQQHFDTKAEAWPYCKFIRMELGRPSGQVSGILEYGSQTITTAFVLQAMLAWHRFQ